MHHIVATLTIALDVAEPKRTGVRSGYAPHHRFSRVEYLTSGRHFYGDDQWHFPGEKIKVWISFVSWQYMRDSVCVGDSFEALELDRLIGYGVVEEILK